MHQPQRKSGGGDVITVRRATINDLPRVYEIEVESFSDPYPPMILLSLIHLYPELFLVAEAKDHGVVGYASGVIDMDGAGHVMSIAVAKDWRRRGVGRRLLSSLEDEMRKLGAKKARLEVSEKNVTAISFYKELGYKEKKRIPSYYPDGSAALVMEKEL